MNKAIIKNLYRSPNFILTRLKSDKHWASKKLTSKDRALNHFDDFYSTVFAERWRSIRVALLSPHKYCAIVNRFGDTEETIRHLENAGAINVKSLIDIESDNYARKVENNDEVEKIYKLDQKLEEIMTAKVQEEIQSIYAENETSISSLQQNSEESNRTSNETTASAFTNASLRSSLDAAEYDMGRIIDPSVGLSASALYEYIPATKLKGMEDWVLESDHYKYYENTSEFPVEMQKDVIHFPEHLLVYSYERNNIESFKSPSKGSTGVLNYYLMDGGSLLPVLALGLAPGDKVLDMCAAPGGKSFLMMQTLYPDCIVCNDVQTSRTRRITNIFKDYLYNYEKWSNRLVVTQNDARAIDDQDMYNRILVDVPCTTDRHCLHNDANNIFKTTRTKERLRLPELQAAILTNALKIVKVGGTVVYSTCSLSPIQNDGVVHMALKRIWQETDMKMVVKDLTDSLKPYDCLFKIDKRLGMKYGNLVVPFLPNNFGPMYFCKIERIN